MEETLRQQVEQRAYELFLARGGNHGYHLEDWLQAERDILGPQKAKAPAKATKAPASPKRK